jgi:hypothetical protein
VATPAFRHQVRAGTRIAANPPAVDEPGRRASRLVDHGLIAPEIAALEGAALDHPGVDLEPYLALLTEIGGKAL